MTLTSFAMCLGVATFLVVLCLLLWLNSQADFKTTKSMEEDMRRREKEYWEKQDRRKRDRN